ncbi:MAG TPA: PDZ domain-containing protein [Pirellulales bacterium]|nr:PDZ domain-containing protein [Pirellulales bacterium]
MKRIVVFFLLLALVSRPILAEVGVELKQDDGGLLVMKVIPNSPAARGGMQRGDHIVAIDGQPTVGLEPDEVGKLLAGAGKQGPTLTLTVRTEGQRPWQLVIPRERIKAQKLKDAAAQDAAVLAAAAAHNRAVARGRVQVALVGEAAEPDAAILREALDREVQFITKVAELTPTEREQLKQDGAQVIERRGNLLARRNNLAARRVVVVVNGQNQMRQVSQPETPDQLVRRELTPVLKAISRDAWEKFDAERALLDERRQRADVLAHVAALDEALILTGDQREKFSNLLCEHGARMWSRRDSDGTAAYPAQLCLNVRQALDLVDVPEAQRQEIVRPSQEAAYKLMQTPVQLETVFVEPRPEANQLAAQAGLQALLMRQMQRKVVRHGLPPAEERQRLQSLVERMVEHLALVVHLDEAQRQKLLLAGKLDIERHFQPDAGREESSPDGITTVVQIAIAGAKVQLPPIFTDSGSVFQKTLHSRLSAEQLETFAEAERQRGRFHRQAVLAALAVALSNRAALTHAQAEQVEERLAQEMAAPADADDLAAWRRATLTQLIALRPEEIRPLVDDWQWPSAREYVKELAATARDLEAQPAGADPEEMLLGIPVAP